MHIRSYSRWPLRLDRVVACRWSSRSGIRADADRPSRLRPALAEEPPGLGLAVQPQVPEQLGAPIELGSRVKVPVQRDARDRDLAHLRIVDRALRDRAIERLYEPQLLLHRQV